MPRSQGPKRRRRKGSALGTRLTLAQLPIACSKLTRTADDGSGSPQVSKQGPHVSTSEGLEMRLEMSLLKVEKYYKQTGSLGVIISTGILILTHMNSC